MVDGARRAAGARVAVVVLGAVLGAAALAGAGCSHSPKPTAGQAAPPPTAAERKAPKSPQAGVVLVAKISPTQGNTCEGTVRFEGQDDGSVKVTADLSGLAPDTQHGIHVHETGDCSAPDAMSAGAHFNPTQREHGIPPADERHAGDLGNLSSDSSGHAHYEVTVRTVSLVPSPLSIEGKAVIVHAQKDDGTPPAGNSGARVGCGVIAAAGAGPAK